MSTPLPPGRVSLKDIQHALLREFERTRDPRWVQITPGALRQMKHRGDISPGPGYNPVELCRVLDRRFTGELTKRSAS